MDPARRLQNAKEEENVVSVWYGSGNQSFFRRRYFDGYTQYETLNEHGKLERHNVYTGVWYIQQLTKEQRRRNRLLYILLCLAGAAALVYGSTRPLAANLRWYGGTPAFAGFFGFGWIGVAIFNEFTVPQKRTIGDYRASSMGLKRAGLLACIGSGLIALISLIYACIGTQTGAHLLAALAELVSAAAGLAVRLLESRVVYEEKISDLAGKYTM